MLPVLPRRPPLLLQGPMGMPREQSLELRLLVFGLEQIGVLERIGLPEPKQLVPPGQPQAVARGWTRVAWLESS